MKEPIFLITCAIKGECVRCQELYHVRLIYDYTFWVGMIGPNSLRCTKILSQHHPFLSFLPSLFNHVKTHIWMIMMEFRIVMVYNKTLLRILTNFELIFFMGIKI